MTVQALDHVNIITSDLDGTCNFYTELLALERRDGPPPLTPQNAQWLFDREGRAILHLNSLDCPRAYARDVMPGETGSIHHVALRCKDYDAIMVRLEARGADFQLNIVEAIGLRQIFTQDPNGVLLELNFFDD
jgi:catechol 2,3-dioxygenase-like lactoylglutathione lyase family enzyme